MLYRLSGLANVPVQDVNAAIAEMERAMIELRLKGVMINDHVSGVTFDNARFYPFWKAAEELSDLILVHQSRSTVVTPRLDRHHLPNSIGNLSDRTATFATFVCGGVIDKFPDLTVCLCHGGGYTCFGIGRIDRGWRVRPEARVKVSKPPNEYFRSF